MRFNKRTVSQVPISGKTVLVRADYNVPLSSDGQISDDFRIKSSLPTIEYLLKNNCKIVIISHLGRPQGREPVYSLETVATRLQQLLDRKVIFVDDCIGDKVYQTIKKAPKQSIILLENLRFYPGEESNSETFAQKIAKSSTAELFVQDGFGVVHRAHASTDAITHYIPSVAGLLLEREVTAITGAMASPARPLVAVMGGAKVGDKIHLVEKFIKVADRIVIGGAMANTFLAYRGHNVGASIHEIDQSEVLDEIYGLARQKMGEHVDEFIILPRDVAVASQPSKTAKRHTVNVDSISDGDMALDIGEKSIDDMVEVVSSAKTVIWNGTMGYSELPEFSHGSARLSLALASQKTKTKSIIGGGDTADFVIKWSRGNTDDFGHVSTGGGASLELMAGNKLPGVESLLDAPK